MREENFASKIDLHVENFLPLMEDIFHSSCVALRKDLQAFGLCQLKHAREYKGKPSGDATMMFHKQLVRVCVKKLQSCFCFFVFFLPPEKLEDKY